MKLTILKRSPPTAEMAGLLFFAGIGAVVILFQVSDPPISVIPIIVGVGLIGLGIYMYILAGERAVQEGRRHQAWISDAQTIASGLAEGDLAEIPVRISLQKNETCYWEGEATWYEYRASTRRVNYHGLTASIPIAKGFRYRVGSIAPSVERTSELVPIDHGQMYVTNKRIYFDGQQKNTTLTWQGLTEVQLFEGGIILEKNTGKSPHLMIRTGAETAAAIVARHLD